ncbi:MAG: FAD-dependent oxidoreductase [Thermoleophilia bacterium]|nr:FAD-dependent oxidoreductase [Thermoleophilia bacterium]MDH4346226.1 FAD-dependent oxidoreductase [Thermoleophilia bacterium]
MGTPFRIAVVGSGPAGFYATGSLLAAEVPIDVDLIERLPTPWGLVRLGVAPDHPNIKAVSRVFEKTAQKPGFRFLGNVDVGRDVSHAELLELYDAVVYAFGAQTDRRLGIPGEDLPGSWPATAFVAWYNGHPDFQELDFDLSHERAVVIGNGNVAVDVARMLALTAEELAPTDTTDEAIAGIVDSGIREILMLGRRGPVQAAFTTPELLELGELAGADVVVDSGDLELDPASEEQLAGDTHAMRNLDVLRSYAEREPSGKPRALHLRFCVSPVEIVGDGHVEAIEVVRNRLVPDARGVLRAEPTDERELIPCGIVFRSVGYRGVGIDGVPFDESSGTIPNEGGRVLGPSGEPLAGVYCTGWIKRGPTGVIGTNKKDATETVAALLADVAGGGLRASGAAAAAIDALLAERGVDVVSQSGWEAIDAAERTAGEPLGRPRVKLCSWDALLGTARAAAPRP